MLLIQNFSVNGDGDHLPRNELSAGLKRLFRRHLQAAAAGHLHAEDGHALDIVAAKMRLPPGRARAFETAGKQGCDCVAWSRKRRTGFISRQGGYESPRPSSHAGLRDKMSRTILISKRTCQPLPFLKEPLPR